MWVCCSATLRFLAVNAAALRHYGYSRKEFLSMAMAGLRVSSDVAIERHRRKDGATIEVEVHWQELVFEGQRARLGIANDVTAREQVARLEQDGLISNYPNRGFIVQPMSIEEAEDVFRLRAKIEPDAAAASAVIATAADQEAARLAYQAVEADAMSPTSRAVSLNRAFHLALVRPSGRTVTLSLLDRLHVVSERYIRKHLEPVDREDRAHAEHKAIFDAWMDRDSREVRSLLLAHTRGTMDDLRLYYAVGIRLANSRHFPRWYPGSEFRIARQPGSDAP